MSLKLGRNNGGATRSCSLLIQDYRLSSDHLLERNEEEMLRWIPRILGKSDASKIAFFEALFDKNIFEAFFTNKNFKIEALKRVLQ